MGHATLPAMSTIQLRLANATDTGPLLDMMAELNALEDIPWTRVQARAPLLKLLSSIELGCVNFILAEGTICGYAVLTWGFDLEWCGRDAYLTEIYLQPETRGQGVGAAALALVEQCAFAHDAKALHLMVRPENSHARRLYQAAGYSSPERIFLSKPLARPAT